MFLTSASAAVDRAAVDRAVDLAQTLLSEAQGPGPRARDPIGPWGPRGPTPKLWFSYAKTIVFEQAIEHA